MKNRYYIKLSFQARTSNMRHRPIGIGVQGLADAFILLRFPFESEDAKKLNIQIFETIYYGAVEASCELAEKYGTYETYEGSPMSKGVSRYFHYYFYFVIIQILIFYNFPYVLLLR